jgi:hypothetical protein
MDKVKEDQHMGKLTEILHRAGRSSRGTIGFVGQAANAAKPKAAAIIVTAPSVDEAAALVKAGADAVILPAGAELRDDISSEVAWGVDARTAKALTEDESRALHKQGADFVLLGVTAPMRSLSGEIEQFDRALFVPPPEDDPLLIGFRALNVLEADVAVLDLALRAKELAALTVRDFARLRLLSESLRFPVIVTLHDMPALEDVRTVARLGAQGIWLADAAAADVTRLREELERVPREKEPVPGIAGLTGTTSTPAPH